MSHTTMSKEAVYNLSGEKDIVTVHLLFDRPYNRSRVSTATIKITTDFGKVGRASRTSSHSPYYHHSVYLSRLEW